MLIPNCQNLDWEAQDPLKLGFNPDRLAKLNYVIKSEYNNLSGIVVVKNGYIAFEEYFNGNDRNRAFHIASVTKSIISALIGIAIKDGFIESADQKVLDFFPDYPSGTANENRAKITLRHLLSMTAPYPFENFHEPLDKLCTSPDWVKYTLDMLGENGNIGDFKYSTSGAHLLSAIITRSTGKCAKDFANERLFAPIGIAIIAEYAMEAFDFDHLFGSEVKGWVSDPNGHSTGGWGLTLTTRDMARFGQLYLNHGVWNDQKIIPKPWVEESTAWTPNNYGLLWWIFKEENVFAYAAMGDGGNMICCIPEKEIVVAIASEFDMNPKDRWALIKEHILTALTD